MNYSFSISTRQGDEYRIMFIDADISVLAENVQQIIVKQGDVIKVKEAPGGGFAVSLIAIP